MIMLEAAIGRWNTVGLKGWTWFSGIMWGSYRARSTFTGIHTVTVYKNRETGRVIQNTKLKRYAKKGLFVLFLERYTDCVVLHSAATGQVKDASFRIHELPPKLCQ